MRVWVAITLVDPPVPGDGCVARNRTHSGAYECFWSLGIREGYDTGTTRNLCAVDFVDQKSLKCIKYGIDVLRDNEHAYLERKTINSQRATQTTDACMASVLRIQYKLLMQDWRGRLAPEPESLAMWIHNIDGPYLWQRTRKCSNAPKVHRHRQCARECKQQINEKVHWRSPKICHEVQSDVESKRCEYFIWKVADHRS